jgi:hypothetical protein
LERALAILHAQDATEHPFYGIVEQNLRRVAPNVIILDDGRIIDPDRDDPRRKDAEADPPTPG